MSRMRRDEGFTLIEMMVAMSMLGILFGFVVLITSTFLNDNNTYTYRSTAQDSARLVIDRISRDLRNAASPVNNSAPNTLSAGLLERATSYDIAFETVSGSGSPPSGDVTNEMQVRYCLDSNNTLWRQTTTPSSSYTTLPDTTACPSTSSAWVQTSGGSPCCVVLGKSSYQASVNKPVYVTNEIGGNTTRPLFTFSPIGWTSASQINQVDVDMYVDDNPGKLPGATEIATGIDLRNELGAPVADFTGTSVVVPGSPGSRYVNLNASASSDPNGQALSYQWYSAGTCNSSGLITNGTPISGATDQSYTTSTTYPVNTSQTFLLSVTDTAGLTSCKSKSVGIS